MIKYFLIVGFLLSHFYSFPQSNIQSILPFKMGMSKMDIIEVVSSSLSPKFQEQKFQGDTEYLKLNNKPRKEKFSYLKDSVMMNYLVYNVSNVDNLLSNDVKVKLSLVNDKLYKISFEISFDNYAKMKQQYDELCGIKVGGYGFSAKFLSENDFGEKVGESLVYVKSEDYFEKDLIKIDELKISYEIKFESEFDRRNKKWVETNSVSKYLVSICVINLNSTPLTNQGY